MWNFKTIGISAALFIAAACGSAESNNGDQETNNGDSSGNNTTPDPTLCV